MGEGAAGASGGVAGACGVRWNGFARLPSPCPLPQAGEGKSGALSPPEVRDVPPLPLAGEGRGEGTLESTLRGCFRAPPQSVATPHHSRTESREIPRELDRASVPDPRSPTPHAARHRARRPSARGRRQSRRRIDRLAPVAEIDIRSAGGAAGNTTGAVRHRSSAGAERVRLRGVLACRQRALTLPSPASGRGEKRAYEFAVVLRTKRGA